MSTSPPLELRISALIELGSILHGLMEKSVNRDGSAMTPDDDHLPLIIKDAYYSNPWFTIENQLFALRAWSELLQKDSVEGWVQKYLPGLKSMESAKVTVIMAGNIPLVGMHDFVCTLASGHLFIGKLSGDDKILLPAITSILIDRLPEIGPYISFTEEIIRDFDAVIATGNNNSARYFDYYFSSIPHIIRKNRNGVAVILGNESDEDLGKLGMDINQYFGMGCRSVSKVFLPAGYDPGKLFVAVKSYRDALFSHHKYMNNYSYQRTILLMNQVPFYDDGTTLLTESLAYSSPVSMLHFEFFQDLQQLKNKLLADQGLIQCVVAAENALPACIPPGHAQYPKLEDYADGIDTMRFLADIQKK